MMACARWNAFPVLLLSGMLAAAPQLHSQTQNPPEGTRKIVNRVMPQYPGMARAMNIQGSVRLEAVITPNGTVKHFEVLGGHPVLVQAAQNAIREWKWEPSSHETKESIEIKFKP